MSQLKILVCGAGIAGATLAYWLAQAGFEVVMTEKAAEIRNAGLGVDIRGPAVEVIRRMGVEAQIRSRTTGEQGLGFVDTNDRVFALFPIDQENLELSPTSEIEIMRSDLAKVLTAAALEETNVSLKLATYVESISLGPHKASVTFNTGASEEYDLVVAADGLGSNTCKLMFGGSDYPSRAVKSLGLLTAYFTMPRQDHDGDLWKWYTATKSRVLMTRPKDEKVSCGYFSIMPNNESELRAIMQKSTVEQKKELRRMLGDSGWQASRLLSEMDNAPDFYLQHIAQVKLPTWSVGRCAAVGDAAYCPTPLSGVGTSLAILGAYVLAGEITQNVNDHRAAFEKYEATLRPYVERKQNSPWGVPGIAYPKTTIGVSLSNWLLWLVAWSGITKWIGALSSGSEEDFRLPDFDFHAAR